MKVIDKRTVSLTENESEVLEYFDMFLDQGCGIVEAAERALLRFWYNFPGAENDPGSPFTWQFFWWLICGKGDLLFDHHGWPKFWRNDEGVLRFMNLHSDALLAIIDADRSFATWGEQDHAEAWEEAYYGIQFYRK
jgi:hypothetical protein